MSGFPRWKLPFVARGFIRHMREEGGNVRLFPGVAPALDRLHASGATLALVTSNAADNCRRVLGETHYARIAHVECGASILGKQRRLRRTLAATGFPAGNAIYVGDQAEDAMAARAAGVVRGRVVGLCHAGRLAGARAGRGPRPRRCDRGPAPRGLRLRG